MNPHVRPAAKAATQVTLLALMAMAPVMAAPPLATAAGRPASVSVSYADLDIDHFEGAQALYRRIVAAAGQVCQAPAARSPDRRRNYDDCRARAVFQAVTAVTSSTDGAVDMRVQISRG